MKTLLTLSALMLVFTGCSAQPLPEETRSRICQDAVNMQGQSNVKYQWLGPIGTYKKDGCAIVTNGGTDVIY